MAFQHGGLVASPNDTSDSDMTESVNAISSAFLDEREARISTLRHSRKGNLSILAFL